MTRYFKNANFGKFFLGARIHGNKNISSTFQMNRYGSFGCTLIGQDTYIHGTHDIFVNFISVSLLLTRFNHRGFIRRHYTSTYVKTVGIQHNMLHNIIIHDTVQYHIITTTHVKRFTCSTHW